MWLPSVAPPVPRGHAGPARPPFTHAVTPSGECYSTTDCTGTVLDKNCSYEDCCKKGKCWTSVINGKSYKFGCGNPPPSFAV
jgi:hypothetical protein